MDGRLCDSSTMSLKKTKTCHIGRYFIKIPQTVAWVTVNIAVWINSADLGVDPLSCARIWGRGAVEVLHNTNRKTTVPALTTRCKLQLKFFSPICRLRPQVIRRAT